MRLVMLLLGIGLLLLVLFGCSDTVKAVNGRLAEGEKMRQIQQVAEFQGVVDNLQYIRAKNGLCFAINKSYNGDGGYVWVFSNVNSGECPHGQNNR